MIPEEYKKSLAQEQDIQEEESLVEIDQEVIETLKNQMEAKMRAEIEEERLLLINQARAEAEEIIVEAEKKGYEDGYEDGKEKGYNVGISTSRVEAEKIKENALKLVKQAEEYVDNYYRENKEQIIGLAIDIAEAIVNRSIDLSEEDILTLIKPIIKVYNDKERFTIICNPSKKEFLEGRLEELKEEYPKINFLVLEDGDLEKNDCILENENQVIDLGIKKQLDSILKTIKDMERDND